MVRVCAQCCMCTGRSEERQSTETKGKERQQGMNKEEKKKKKERFRVRLSFCSKCFSSSCRVCRSNWKLLVLPLIGRGQPPNQWMNNSFPQRHPEEDFHSPTGQNDHNLSALGSPFDQHKWLIDHCVNG